MAVKVAFHTMGCKLNFAETAHIAETARLAGFDSIVETEISPADVYVINTCSVTENADKECAYLVRRLKRCAPEAVVVMTGCYAQLQGNRLRQIPEVDLVFGVAEKFHIVQHLTAYLEKKEKPNWGCHIAEVQGFHAAISFDSRTRGFLKVQDGCDYHCSFCTIPQARGKSRSDTVEGVLSNIDQMRSLGIKEVILTGINLGDFSSPKGEDFYQLLQAIERHDTADLRFRLSSIEPNLLSEDMVHFVGASTKIVPHVHMPLQSGSNRILGLMRRRYQRELYQERVALIKQQMPDCAIGVDVICGFPSETEEDFSETVSFLEALPVSYLHVFTYSERAHTKALDISAAVPMERRKKYTHHLRLLSMQKQQAFRETQLGKRRMVLFEAPSEDKQVMEGYTDNYLRVKTAYDPSFVGRYVRWEL